MEKYHAVNVRRIPTGTAAVYIFFRQFAFQEAKRILISSRKQAEQERKKLLADTQDEMVTIAMLAARKAVGNNINEEKEKALFEDLLKKVGEA